MLLLTSLGLLFVIFLQLIAYCNGTPVQQNLRDNTAKAPTTELQAEHLANVTTSAVPRLILHIGPHKTASTYIQKFITDHHQVLVAQNLIWPMLNENGDVNQQHSYIPMELRRLHRGVLEKLRKFLDTALTKGNNVILSSEGFDRLSVTQLREFDSMLKGFDVTVVFVHREWLSLLVSWHYQQERDDRTAYSDPFSAYLVKHMDHMEHGLYTMDVLGRYEEVFGTDRLRLIDYYGAKAAGVDIAYVLLCEVAGVLCGDQALFEHTKEVNVKEALVFAQAFDHMRIYMNTVAGSCKACGEGQAGSFRRLFNALLVKSTKPLPVVRSSLSLLVPYAERVDGAVRERYGPVTLYGNATANEAVRISRVQVEELDLKLFLHTPYWTNFFQSALVEGQRARYLCGCGHRLL